MKKRTLHIGLDFGSVIFDPSKPREKVRGMEVDPLTEGALDALKNLKEAGHKLSVISRVDPGEEHRVLTQAVLQGVCPEIFDPKDVYFCNERSEKGPIAQKLGLDVFLDDRPECLDSLLFYSKETEHCVQFTGVYDRSAEPWCPQMEGDFVRINSWSEFLTFIHAL